MINFKILTNDYKFQLTSNFYSKNKGKKGGGLMKIVLPSL